MSVREQDGQRPRQAWEQEVADLRAKLDAAERYRDNANEACAAAQRLQAAAEANLAEYTAACAVEREQWRVSCTDKVRLVLELRERVEKAEATARTQAAWGAEMAAKEKAEDDAAARKAAETARIATLEADLARVTAERDEAYASGFGKAGVLALESQLAAERARCGKLARFIVVHYDRRVFTGDWACAECHPNSDMLVADFQCGYHLALAAGRDLDPADATSHPKQEPCADKRCAVCWPDDAKGGGT